MAVDSLPVVVIVNSVVAKHLQCSVMSRVFGRGCYLVSGVLCSVVGVIKFCWMQRILKISGK